MLNTFVVSGRPRSGTSMMMRALGLSGLKMRYDDRPERTQAYKDAFKNTQYHPNPWGFFENGIINYRNGEGEGEVCKVFARELDIKCPVLPDVTYNVVVMIRPETEIKLSFTNGFGIDFDLSSIMTIPEIMDYLATRSDFNWIALNFADVIANPLDTFKKLVAAGWPIDPVMAASTIDPTLYRSKL